MPKQSIDSYEEILDLWILASKGKEVRIAYPEEKNYVTKTEKLRSLFYNVRRKIRTRKLNPKYSQYWEAMLACELIRFSPTELIIRRKYPLHINNKHVSIK